MRGPGGFVIAVPGTIARGSWMNCAISSGVHLLPPAAKVFMPAEYGKSSLEAIGTADDAVEVGAGKDLGLLRFDAMAGEAELERPLAGVINRLPECRCARRDRGERTYDKSNPHYDADPPVLTTVIEPSPSGR